MLRARHHHDNSMEPLQPVLQHRAILLLEHVEPHFDPQIRPDPKDIPVESRVMQRTEREPVRHDRQSTRMPVRQNVRRLQQLEVSQPADRAPLSVRTQDAHSERLLVQSKKRRPGRIAARLIGFELQISEGCRT